MDWATLLRLRIYLVAALTLLVMAGRAAEAEGGEVAAAVRRPIHPLLIGGERGALLAIDIDAPAEGATIARVFDLSIAGAGDIESVGVFVAGEGGEFEGAAEFDEPAPAADRLVVRGEQLLRPGRNVFWVAARLKATADWSHRIGAVCTAIETTAGTTIPRDYDPTRRQRIGVALRKAGEGGTHTHRIPALATSAVGTLLCVYDLRHRAGRDLQEDIDIGLARSSDGGRTWSASQTIMDMGEYGGLPQEQNGCSDPGIVVDRQTGEIFCFAVWMHGKAGKHQWTGDGSEPGFEIGKAAQLMVVRSRDDGLTWSEPENVTKKLKEKNWWLLAPSPQAGIQLADGTLVMPFEGRSGGEPLETFATIAISRDHGATWQVGRPGFLGGNECQVAQLGDGSLMLNVRNDRQRFRGVVVTDDLGETWRPHETSECSLIEPNCNGSLLRVDYVRGAEKSHVLLFANPYSQETRTRHTLQVSFDDGRTWPKSHRVLLDDGRGAGYASLTQIDGEHVGIVYEGSQAQLVFQKIAIDELLAGAERAPAASQATTTHDPNLYLFADDRWIADRRGVKRVFNLAAPLPEPILWPDDPASEAECAWGNVIREDEGRFRLFYCTINMGANGQGPHEMAKAGVWGKGDDFGFYPRSPADRPDVESMIGKVAESDDGLHWRKPKLGLVEVDGSKENNVILTGALASRQTDGALTNFDGYTIVRDERESDPQKRYKMIAHWESVHYWDNHEVSGSLGRPADRMGRYAAARGEYITYSPDGLVWEQPLVRLETLPSGGGDRLLVVRDVRRQRWMAYVRAGGHAYPALSYSDDLHTWSAAEMAPEISPADVQAPAVECMIPFNYGNQDLAFPCGMDKPKGLFTVMLAGRHDSDSPRESGQNGKWSWIDASEPFIPKGPPGSYYATGAVPLHNEPILVGDELLIYFNAFSRNQAEPCRFGNRTIGVARMRRDGFAGLRAENENDAGELVTAPLAVAGDALFVNVEQRSGAGSVTAALLDEKGQPLEGFSFNESIAIEDDGVRLPLAWTSGGRISGLLGRKVKVAVRLQGGATLYALAFAERQ